MLFRGLWKSIFGRQAPVTPLFFYNTLGKHKEKFELPSYGKTVKMYNCGPTVYGVQHIGNLSMFVFTDILRRALQYNGFSVKQVINFTDFGHLTSDADEGEDKMMRGLKREGLKPTLENMRAMGRKYAGIFKDDLKKLNIDTDTITFPFASDFIPAQIAMIETLEQKAYAYKTKGGVYFDTSHFPSYGELGGLNQNTGLEGARVAVNPEKRNPSDFILWKSDPKIGWESPWGMGFPGWHIECSAMINAILGKQVDIHTGGIEHISIHHNNEIAQSESATGKRPLSRFWLHRAHLQIEGTKIAKSEGNTIYLSDILEKGFHPLSFRYLLLGAHYRTPASFSWTALEAAQTAFLKLRRFVDSIPASGRPLAEYQKKISERLRDDLDTPGALALIWEMIKTPQLPREAVRATILDADNVFGLGLEAADPEATALCRKMFGASVEEEKLPEQIQKLVTARGEARAARDWTHADALRLELERRGYTMEDTALGVRVFKKE